MISASHFRNKGLLSLSLIYLAIPNILFLLGWVRPWIAIPLIIFIIVGCILTVRKSSPQETTSCPVSHFWALITSLVIGAIWCFLIGIGGQTAQPWDFEARNPIYETLVRCDWPILSRQGEYFIYYHAFLLTPSIIAKIWEGGSLAARPSWFIINTIWTYIGIALMILLMYRKLGWKILVFIIIAMLLGSPAEDAHKTYIPSLASLLNLKEFYMGFSFQYALSPGITSQLFNTYYHATPTWLILAIIIAGRLNRNSILFVSSLLVLLSPIAAIGSLVLLFFIFISEYQNDRHTLRKWLFSPEFLIGCLICIVIALYYSGGNTPVSFALSETPQTTKLAPTCMSRILPLFFNIALPVMVFVIILGKDGLKSPIGKTVFALLIIPPFIYVGHLFNELLFKIAAVSLILFAYLIALKWGTCSKMKHALIVLLVCASSLTQVKGYMFTAVRSITFNIEGVKNNYRSKLQGHLNHPEIWYHRHFFGSKPSHYIYYTQAGESAGGLMKWCATNNSSDAENLPPDYYPNSIYKKNKSAQ